MSAGIVAKNLPKLGAKIPTAAGPVLIAAAMLWLTQVSADGSYAVDMLPALVLMGVGLGMAFVPMQNPALFGVANHDAGVASALVNASQQIGGSLGTALFSTIAAAAAVTTGGPLLESLSAGYAAVFFWAAVVAILITPIALLLITIDRRTFSGTASENARLSIFRPHPTHGRVHSIAPPPVPVVRGRRRFCRGPVRPAQRPAVPGAAESGRR
jgi:hypothetical protein